jgi:hypothetical protein
LLWEKLFGRFFYRPGRENNVKVVVVTRSMVVIKHIAPDIVRRGGEKKTRLVARGNTSKEWQERLQEKNEDT